MLRTLLFCELVEKTRLADTHVSCKPCQHRLGVTDTSVRLVAHSINIVYEPLTNNNVLKDVRVVVRAGGHGG